MVKKIFGVSIVLGGLLLSAVPAFAASAETSANAACVGTAVSVREAALDSGITAYNSAVASAYSVRAGALGDAYKLTPGKGVISAAVKKAWSTFRSSMKTARSAWSSTRNSAWSQFRSSAKICKAPTSIQDHSNVSSEASGN